MVGVPGRSKGCNTCRQRRIACGLEKPQCAQCIKSDRACMGYQRERIFIPNQGADQEGPKVYTRRPPSDRLLDRSKGLEDGRPKFSTKKKEDMDAQLISPITWNSTIAKTIPPYLAYRQQLLSNFLISFKLLADFSMQGYGASQDKPGAWLCLLPELAPRARALELSSLAVCTAKLGRLYNDPMLVRESLRFYVQGLPELRKALRNPTLMLKDETLAACMLLQWYEGIECPAKNLRGWISHVNGCSKLIELRGPEAHRSALGHELFLAFRLREIAKAIAYRRSTYMSRPEWLEVPFRDHLKTPFHQLLDIAAALPNVIEQGYQIRGSDPTSRLFAIQGVIESCWKIDAELRQFYEELERTSLGPLYWPELSKEDNPADDAQLGKVFPVAFHFLNLRMAHICMLYWASLVILWSGLSYTYKIIANLRRIVTKCLDSNCCEDSAHETACSGSMEARKLRSAISKINNLPPLEHRQDVVSISRNICQSVEYCMHDELQGLWPILAYFPLKVAVETFNDYPDCSRELLWAKAVMEKVSDSSVRLLKFLSRPVTRKAYVPV